MPRTIVNPTTERDGSPSPPSPPDPRFLAVINAYDSDAPAELRTTGTARDARYVRPSGWPAGIGYNFWRKNQNTTVVQLEFSEKWRECLADCLASFDGREVADRKGKLSWDPTHGKLNAEFPIEQSGTIAQAMRDLILMTKDVVSAKINECLDAAG